jgi:hypothetical protein
MSSTRLHLTSGVLVALAVTLLLWASAYAGIRAGLRGYSPTDLLRSRWASTLAWRTSGVPNGETFLD